MEDRTSWWNRSNYSCHTKEENSSAVGTAVRFVRDACQTAAFCNAVDVSESLGCGSFVMGWGIRHQLCDVSDLFWGAIMSAFYVADYNMLLFLNSSLFHQVGFRDFVYFAPQESSEVWIAGIVCWSACFFLFERNALYGKVAHVCWRVLYPNGCRWVFMKFGFGNLLWMFSCEFNIGWYQTSVKRRPTN